MEDEAEEEETVWKESEGHSSLENEALKHFFPSFYPKKIKKAHRHFQMNYKTELKQVLHGVSVKNKKINTIILTIIIINISLTENISPSSHFFASERKRERETERDTHRV